MRGIRQAGLVAAAALTVLLALGCAWSGGAAALEFLASKTGKLKGKALTTQKFKAVHATFECPEDTPSGEVTSTKSTKLEVTITYVKCLLSGHEASYGSSHYLFSTPKSVLFPKERTTLKGTSPTCTILILANQSLGSGAGEVEYENKGGKLVTKEKVGHVLYEVTESSSETSCGKVGEKSSGEYTGNNELELEGGTLEVRTAPATEPLMTETYGLENPAEIDIEHCLVGKPVNCATGNEVEAQTDVAVGGRGPGLDVTRTYDALQAAEAKEAGPWGYGWTGPWDAHLTLNAGEETATVEQENGSSVVFYATAGKYVASSWVQATLVKEGSNYLYTLPDQSKLEFNSEGQLVKETEHNGNSNTFTYNGSKQLEKVKDGDERLLTFKYTASGLVESVTDPMSHVVKYSYSAGNLASVTIEGKERWKFEYESHLLTTITDGRGHSTTIKYEATTHKVTEETAGGHKRKWEYKSGETKLIEPNGSETVETFDAAGEPTKVTRAKGSSVETTTEYEYETGTYTRTKLIDPNKHTTEYKYDEEGNKISEKDPGGDEHKWKYDKAHNVLEETTPEGETTTIKRNEHGEPTVIESPIGTEVQKTELKYGTHGELSEEIDPLGHTTKYTYDAAGDKETETDGAGDERKWKYNEDSQATEETNGRGFTTKITRDEQGRPTKISDPLGHLTEYVYDGDGNVTSETDGNKHATKDEYNEENLLTRAEEPNKTLVETGYDSEGQMTSHTDGNKHTWEYKRNLLEQVTEEKNPLGKRTLLKYEKAGNLETREDPETHTTTYKYDTLNRLTLINYSTGKPSEVTFEYNKDNKVTKMKDETGTTEYTWDKLDRITLYKNGAGKLVKYEYDLANLPTKITYPNGEHITREYDKADRLENVTDFKGNVTSFDYNKDSQLEKTLFPAATEATDEYSYNEADQLTLIKMLKKASVLASLEYERDNDGQVKKTTSKGLPGSETNESLYDENNRLSEASKQAYEYDKANNPLKIAGLAGYTYNEANELTESHDTKYAYNEDGQRTKLEPKTGEHTLYTYDQVGNVTGVKQGTSIEDSYTYDGNGLRQTQTIKGTKANLVWGTAESLPILLLDETNSYIYGPEGTPIEQISETGETSYLHHDQQGSTRLITNTKGENVGAYTYTPYGAVEEHTGTATTPLGYDGQYTNNSTGLIYLRARTYDPKTAQFLTVDPALEETGEPYTYASDNPLNTGDQTGEQIVVRYGDTPSQPYYQPQTTPPPPLNSWTPLPGGGSVMITNHGLYGWNNGVLSTREYGQWSVLPSPPGGPAPAGVSPGSGGIYPSYPSSRPQGLPNFNEMYNQFNQLQHQVTPTYQHQTLPRPAYPSGHQHRSHYPSYYTPAYPSYYTPAYPSYYTPAYPSYYTPVCP